MNRWQANVDWCDCEGSVTKRAVLGLVEVPREDGHRDLITTVVHAECGRPIEGLKGAEDVIYDT